MERNNGIGDSGDDRRGGDVTRRPRRAFLGWLGAISLTAGAFRPASGEEPPPVGPQAGGNARARSSLAEREALAWTADTDWDLSWVEKLTAQHKAVFDSPGVGEGMALYRAIGWCKQYNKVFGTPRSDMNPVLVYRHESISLVMDDSYWETFHVGKTIKMKDEKSGKWYVTNPIRTVPPDTPPQWADFDLEHYQADGGIVLACNLAFADVVTQYQERGKLSREDARKEALQHLLPGVILQPSGIFAVLRAQEAGCDYVMAS
jgi:hypothetical protein